MPSFVVNPKSVRPFASAEAFEAWLKQNHASASEVWIKVYKKGSGTPSIDTSEAIDVALCWGWIDGIRKAFDEAAFLQRFTPRQAKSRWSQINVKRVELLVKAKRMTEHGQRHVDAAKADGRWEAAYASPKNSEVPADFLAAVAKHPRAAKTFELLTKQYKFSIAYRLFHLKSAERRAQLITDMVKRLGEGELPYAKPLRPTDKKPEPKDARKDARKLARVAKDPEPKPTRSRPEAASTQKPPAKAPRTKPAAMPSRSDSKTKPARAKR